ncbi:MAG: arsenate reductase ArsC [Promethearchaeota archaeon]
MEKIKIIFACVHNSCRSQMAEGLANKYKPVNVEVLSAGTQPASEVNKLAVEVMKEISIDISKNKPKLLTYEMLTNAIYLISMGCGVMESCPVFLVEGKLIIEDWNIEDPAGKNVNFFRSVRDVIERKVMNFFEKFSNHS